MSKTPPINGIPFYKVFNASKKTSFNGNVKPNDTLEEVLCVIEGLLNKAFENDALECINLDDLGIKCADKDKSKLCVVMEWITENLLLNIKAVAQLLINIQKIQTGLGTFKDEKVKVRAAGTAKYLEDIIDAPVGSVLIKDDKISFFGFVPIGFRGTVNKNRLGDFDGTGKGKLGTDVWGYGIRNGQNGLDNALGLFPMYTDVLASAGTQGGKSNFTLTKDNITSFAVPVAGIINEALNDNVRFKVGYRHYRSFDGSNSGASRAIKDVVSNGGDEDWFTVGANFRHSHAFTLSATHTNPTPTPIDLIPKHIKEIPIERIIP